ncbi:MAG: hypothetical protein ACREQL_02790, partial [Candidatus Binatia bacterium]
MTGAWDSRIAAVVVAARGGDDLARALARAAWADERLVLDPTQRVEPAGLPAGTRHVVDPARLAEATTAEWLVLLGENDLFDAPASAAVRDAVGGATSGDGFALPVETRTLDLELDAGTSMMVAPRRTRVVVRRGSAIGLDAGGLRVRRLAASVVRERGASLT